ncbi:MAG TPA: UDP-3-O-(3-hydroxymyristoyl)glucosamine N-acyltransferase, partial [Candidatus Hydrogenedentes bacterium]|nr:UDP-3-O-(3-hydroxymyristoyl)glucosamine N-acyltransferase [Candidatus Hydrogenedentota bacterium]
VYPNAVILEGVRVGARCILHSGVVLGADGFGFTPHERRWQKIPQIGTVELGDDVEVGANTAIDRATFGATRIGRGTKIDNLVQIGHNVNLGEDCVLSGKVGIAGSATIGHHVVMGARAGVGGHIEIGDGVRIGGMSGVSKSVKPGQVVSGYPAMEHRKALRIQASQRMLPDALQRLRHVEQRLEELERRIHGQPTDNR